MTIIKNREEFISFHAFCFPLNLLGVRHVVLRGRAAPHSALQDEEQGRSGADEVDNEYHDAQGQQRAVLRFIAPGAPFQE